MTFDTWEVGIQGYSGSLMHWGIPGMKHGRNRYQNPDGTWTDEGLARRRQREGFGESKKEQKLEKKIQRAEKKQARKEARAAKKFERSEARRKRTLKGLTDEEMKAKLERAKMEAEYRDLTKRHTFIESGTKLVNSYLNYKAKKEQRALEINRQILEKERLRTQRVQAKAAAAQAKYSKTTSKNEAKKAKQEAKKMKQDVKGGLKIKRKADLKREKLNYRNTTIRGALGNFLNAGAKEVGSASGEYKRDRSHVRALLNNQRSVDKYNASRPKGQKKLQAEETMWQRQQTEARERRANAEAVAKANVEKEKWRSRRKI